MSGMTSRRPPARPSAASPSSGSSQPPKRRETIEVQLEWLEEEPDTKPKKRPPRVPNARIQPPPMPVTRSGPPPPRRATKPPEHKTMEVDMRELILVPRVPGLNLLKPTRPVGKPIPREEEDTGPRPPTSDPGGRRGASRR
jgi:hypothetical protein